jgi:hypothetical protein
MPLARRDARGYASGDAHDLAHVRRAVGTRLRLRHFERTSAIVSWRLAEPGPGGEFGSGKTCGQEQHTPERTAAAEPGDSWRRRGFRRRHRPVHERRRLPSGRVLPRRSLRGRGARAQVRRGRLYDGLPRRDHRLRRRLPVPRGTLRGPADPRGRLRDRSASVISSVPRGATARRQTAESRRANHRNASARSTRPRSSVFGSSRIRRRPSTPEIPPSGKDRFPDRAPHDAHPVARDSLPTGEDRFAREEADRDPEHDAVDRQ